MIYLASASPRRQELLRQIGVHFKVLHPDISEIPHVGESPRDYAARLAQAKARAVAAMLPRDRADDYPILAADTCVILDGEILGKPTDRTQAQDMLRRLSGRGHEVISAFAIYFKDQMHTGNSISEVHFAVLGEQEIVTYAASGEAFDKAGGYAAQGHAAAFITQIKGSYSGIVGLPVYEVSRKLKEAGLWDLARTTAR